MSIIVDGQKIADQILSGLKIKVKKLKAQGIQPALAVVLVGDDRPSQTYVNKKQKAAKEIGINFFKLEYPALINKERLIEEIKEEYTGEYVVSWSLDVKEADSWDLPFKFKGTKLECENYIDQQNAK